MVKQFIFILFSILLIFSHNVTANPNNNDKSLLQVWTEKRQEASQITTNPCKSSACMTIDGILGCALHEKMALESYMYGDSAFNKNADGTPDYTIVERNFTNYDKLKEVFKRYHEAVEMYQNLVAQNNRLKQIKIGKPKEQYEHEAQQFERLQYDYLNFLARYLPKEKLFTTSEKAKELLSRMKDGGRLFVPAPMEPKTWAPEYKDKISQRVLVMKSAFKKTLQEFARAQPDCMGLYCQMNCAIPAIVDKDLIDHYRKEVGYDISGEDVGYRYIKKKASQCADPGPNGSRHMLLCDTCMSSGFFGKSDRVISDCGNLSYDEVK